MNPAATTPARLVKRAARRTAAVTARTITIPRAVQHVAGHPEDVTAYHEIVRRFRELTTVTWPDGRCCVRTRDGVPQCCYLVVDGEDLYYTAREVAILLAADMMPLEGFTALPRYAGRVFTLDRSYWTPALLQESLWRGAVAATVESASHPTRPVLIGRQVVGVAAAADCNTGVALPLYRSHQTTLRELWQRMVDLTGPKPYYVTRTETDLVLV